MPLLIDGHNLIGSGVFDDIHLSDEDDEAKLVARLRVWQSRYRGKITVIFDHGITAGLSRELSGGGVKALFARNPQEADDLIRRRLRSGARGLVVVTNDADLQRAASSRRVDVWPADEFVRRMTAMPAHSQAGSTEAGAEAQVSLSAGEVDEWMALFGARPPASAPATGGPAGRPRPRPPAPQKRSARRRNAKKRQSR